MSHFSSSSLVKGMVSHSPVNSLSVVRLLHHVYHFLLSLNHIGFGLNLPLTSMLVLRLFFGAFKNLFLHEAMALCSQSSLSALE